MITEIPKQEWKDFFDNLSRDLDGWETHIDVFSNDVGAQVVSGGLPFHGLTSEEDKNGEIKIELLIGSGTESHQTRTVEHPVNVAFESAGVGPGGVVYIEDASGTKTFIKFVQPFPVLVESVNTEIVSVASGGK